MFIPPKMTQIIHEDRIRHLITLQKNRRLGEKNVNLFKRVWINFRNIWRRNDEWVRLPLESEPYEVSAELLRNHPMPITHKDGCAPDAGYQQGDPA